jgi:hypothetical protein
LTDVGRGAGGICRAAGRPTRSPRGTSLRQAHGAASIGDHRLIGIRPSEATRARNRRAPGVGAVFHCRLEMDGACSLP